jgi:hypothetical protein
LHPALKRRVAENNIFSQEESHGETDTKGEKQGGYVGFECIESKGKASFFQYIMVTDIVYQEPQQRIAPTCGRIAESLQGHPFPEWPVKKINDGQNKIAYAMKMPLHESANLSAEWHSCASNK